MGLYYLNGLQATDAELIIDQAGQTAETESQTIVKKTAPEFLYLLESNRFTTWNNTGGTVTIQITTGSSVPLISAAMARYNGAAVLQETGTFGTEIPAVAGNTPLEIPDFSWSGGSAGDRFAVLIKIDNNGHANELIEWDVGNAAQVASVGTESTNARIIGTAFGSTNPAIVNQATSPKDRNKVQKDGQTVGDDEIASIIPLVNGVRLASVEAWTEKAGTGINSSWIIRSLSSGEPAGTQQAITEILDTQTNVEDTWNKWKFGSGNDGFVFPGSTNDYGLVWDGRGGDSNYGKLAYHNSNEYDSPTSAVVWDLVSSSWVEETGKDLNFILRRVGNVGTLTDIKDRTGPAYSPAKQMQSNIYPSTLLTGLEQGTLFYQSTSEGFVLLDRAWGKKEAITGVSIYLAWDDGSPVTDLVVKVYDTTMAGDDPITSSTLLETSSAISFGADGWYDFVFPSPVIFDSTKKIGFNLSVTNITTLNLSNSFNWLWKESAGRHGAVDHYTDVEVYEKVGGAWYSTTQDESFTRIFVKTINASTLGEPGGGALVGSSAGSTTVTGVLTGIGNIIGTAAGSTSLTADLIGYANCAASAAGSTTVTGVISAIAAIVGAVFGSTTVVAILLGIGSLIGVSNGTTTASATLIGYADLIGTTSGSTTVTGTLLGTGSLVGASAGSTTVAGTLIGYGSLAGTTAGTTTVAGTLTGIGELIGSSAGSTTVTGVLTSSGSIGELIGSSAGSTTVTATLIGYGDLARPLGMPVPIFAGAQLWFPSDDRDPVQGIGFTNLDQQDGILFPSVGALVQPIKKVWFRVRNTGAFIGTLEGYIWDVTSDLVNPTLVATSLNQITSQTSNGWHGFEFTPFKPDLAKRYAITQKLIAYTSGSTEVAYSSFFQDNAAPIERRIYDTTGNGDFANNANPVHYRIDFDAVAELTGIGSLIGTSNGTTSVTADLIGYASITGVANGSTTATSTLTGYGDLIGAANGSTTVSSILIGYASITGVSNGSTTVTAILTGLGNILGTAAGSTTITGTLIGTGALVGTSAGSTTTAGNLTNADAGALNGTANGTTTITGILTGTGNILGTANGTTTITGILIGTGNISGTVNAFTDVAGILKGTGSLVGISNGTTSVTGTIIGIGELVGTTSGSTTVTGTLIGYADLIGSASGSTTITGDLIGIGELIGAISGSTSVTGILIGTGSLIGTASGSSTASATLIGTGQLLGTTAGSTTVSGNLTNADAGALNGSSAGSTTVTADLIGYAPITGTTSGSTTATGVLSAIGDLAGTSNGTTSVTGTLTGIGELIGTVSGSTTVTGTLSGIGELVGISNGSTTVAGNLTDADAGALNGTANGTTTITGILIGWGDLVGAASGSTTVTGDLTTGGSIGELIGVSNGSTNVTGTLTGTGSLVGTSSGSTTITGDLIGIAPLTGVANGSTTATSVLIGYGPLSGTVNAYTDVAGILKGWGYLLGTSNGSTVGVGTLTGTGSLVGVANGVATGIGILAEIASSRESVLLETPICREVTMTTTITRQLILITKILE